MPMRVSSSRSQKLCLRFSENYDFHKAISHQPEGRYGQSSRNVGVGCDGRNGVERAISARTNHTMADGEGVWSWHPWAGAKSVEMIGMRR
jgi:hypothetical protein